MQQTNDIFFHPENNEGGFFMLSFDTSLLLVKDASFTTAKRLKSYASSAEAAAGLGRRHEKNTAGAVRIGKICFGMLQPALLLPRLHFSLNCLCSKWNSIVFTFRTFLVVFLVFDFIAFCTTHLFV